MEKLTTWRKALETPTLEAAGKLLGVSAVQMMRLEKGERRVPAERLAEFEAVTGIPREELRPDIFARSVTPAAMDAARYEEALESAAPVALP